MAQVIHLIVENGDDKGKQISVPAEGARVGRSSKNDVVLMDPLLSRHHCRLFFKTGDGLWVTDLGSANQTMVNNKAVQEMRLHVGDLVTIGDTIMRVLNDGVSVAGRQQLDPQVLLQETQPLPANIQAPKSAVVDLGISPDQEKPARPKIGTGPLLLLAALVTGLALAVWVPRLMKPKGGARSPTRRPVQVVGQKQNLPVLEIVYEKVEANKENIFRYYLVMSKNGKIAVEIDDIKNERHLRRGDQVATEYCQNLARTLLDSGFFDLEERYEGIQPDIHESYDLSITIGSKTHRTRVENRAEPDTFKGVRERIEESGKNLLGLAALPYTREKLIEMAQEAYLLGYRLYDEREVKHANLFNAIRNLQFADLYLETVDPKPDFYKKTLAGITDFKRELDQKYKDQAFRAERAIKMRAWEDAQKEFLIVLDMIPDTSDSRHKDARTSLLEIESHLEKKK